MCSLASGSPAGKGPGDPVDCREQLWNAGLTGPAGSIQVPAERITRLSGILLDLDPGKLVADNPWFPPADDPLRFLANIRPVLRRHPLARHAEVRLSGTGLHGILRLDPPVELTSAAEQKWWASLVRAVQCSMPVDPNAPGITALTRAVGSVNSKTGAVVAVLEPGEPIDPRAVIEFVAGLARAAPSGPWRRSCSAPSISSPARSAAATGPTSTSSIARAGATATAAASAWRGSSTRSTGPSSRPKPPVPTSDRVIRDDPGAGAASPRRRSIQERRPDHGFPGVSRTDPGVDAPRQPARLSGRPGGRRPRPPDHQRRHPSSDHSSTGQTLDGFLAQAGQILAGSGFASTGSATRSSTRPTRRATRGWTTLAVQHRAEPNAAPILANLFGVGYEAKQGVVQSLAASKLIGAVLADESVWQHLPEIKFYARRPTFDLDFQLCAPGWNAASGILVHAPEVVPATHAPASAPDAPALDRLPPRLRALFAEFSWRSDADLVNALAMLLTGLLINHFVDDPHPGGLVDANQPGTGKTLYVQVVGRILDGAEPPRTALVRDEELEKRLCAQLRSSRSSVYFLDNVRARIESAVLEQNMLSPLLSFRILGKSATIERPNAALWMITSNLTAGTPDFIRRCVPIRQFVEGDPKARVFTGNPLAYATEHRPGILGELAGMVLRWVEQGRPLGTQRHRCDRWAATIGGLLDANGLGEFFLANAEEAEVAMDQGLVDLGHIGRARRGQGPGRPLQGGRRRRPSADQGADPRSVGPRLHRDPGPARQARREHDQGSGDRHRPVPERQGQPHGTHRDGRRPAPRDAPTAGGRLGPEVLLLRAGRALVGERRPAGPVVGPDLGGGRHGPECRGPRTGPRHTHRSRRAVHPEQPTALRERRGFDRQPPTGRGGSGVARAVNLGRPREPCVNLARQRFTPVNQCHSLEL